MMNRGLARRFVACLVLAPITLACLAACGGDSGSSTSGGAASSAALETLTACSLLTAEEIRSATGRAPAEGKDMSQVGGRLPICNWPPADGETYDSLVNLLVTVNAYDSYAEFLESARSSPVAGAFSDDAVEEVSDVGDFGVWMREASMLQIYAGDRMVQVTVTPAIGRDALAAARTLGTAAIGRVK